MPHSKRSSLASFELEHPMQAKLAVADQMTIEEFLAFMDSRPDGERWELIEGVAIMNASPTDWHQTVCLNIGSELREIKSKTGAKWSPILDIGTRVPVSPRSLPRPDVLVKEGQMSGQSWTDDALVLFEIISKSNTKSDQAWRKRVYASVPNCQHYLTVSMKSAEITRYDRADGWVGTTIKGLAAKLPLPAMHCEIPLRDIYLSTPIT
jgi:Uma2 family endonuclease